VAAVGTSSHDFANGGWTNVGFTDDKGIYRTFSTNVIDEDYLHALMIEMVMGRNFSDENPADKKRSIIVNESFLKVYGWEDITGKKIPGKNFPDHEIIGVMKDFNYSSLYTRIEPLVLVNNPIIILEGIENINIDNSPVPKLMVRLKPGNMSKTVDKINEAWKKITGGEELLYHL
jgi:putative ABC transport system permease protein